MIRQHRQSHSLGLLSVLSRRIAGMIRQHCLDRAGRAEGLTVQLLRGAVQYATEQGAQVVEGYPVELEQEMPALFAYTGLVSAFKQAGFVEVARRSERRPMMRYWINAL